MSKILLLSLILCLLSPTIQAQTTISGQVTDGSHPLPWASLVVDGTEMGTSSDEKGQFSIDQLPPGAYTITASYVGHSAQSKDIQLLEDQPVVLDFILSPAQALDQIVVTGTMKPTYVTASPIKVDVVTSKQLDTYIPAASSSIIEGIQLINGVEEVVACGVCYTNSISINGLDGAYTAVLMDGMPMYGNLASVYGLNGIPNMIIDRFEVIKGPSSTLYGTEAVAGVINIITKDPSEQPLLSVDVMGTSHMEAFGNLALAPKIGVAEGYIGLNYAYINDYDDANSDGFGDGILLDRYSLFTKWNIRRKHGRTFTIAGKLYYEDRRNGVAQYVADRAYRQLRGSDRVYGESVYTRRYEIFGQYQIPVLPRHQL